MTRRQEGCVGFLDASKVLLGVLAVGSVYPFQGSHCISS